ncbi:MAG: glutamate carboxypeptidase [Planctomycetota bacterium]|jgi:glutamate carboxypeptidase
MPLNKTEVKVSERLKSMGPQLDEWLRHFVSFDTHTDNHEQINALGWELEQEFMKSGLRTSAFVTGVSGQYLIARTRQTEGHKLMLLGHTDTVFPTGAADLELKTSGDNDAVFLGPGAADMKGGVVVMLGAIRALAEEGLLDNYALTVLLSADEETGSPAGRDLIAKEAEEQHLCLVFEAGSPMDGGGSRFVTGRKGMGRFHLEIQGVAAHSGIDKEAGLSAALEASQKIVALEALNDAAAGNSVNVGIVTSGTAINTVPEHAHLEIDCRFTEPEKGEELLEKIRQICNEPATQNSSTGKQPELTLVELCGHKPFVRTEAIGRMAKRICDWGADLGLTLEEESRGGSSDGNITASIGIPTVDGLGVVGGKIHSNQEWLEKSSLVERSRLLALTMMRFYEL